MTIYVYDKNLGKVVEKSMADIEPLPRLEIMPDIQPYQSMVDGSRIASRSTHRDHLRAHDVVEVGNEKMESRPKPLNREKRRAQLREQLRDMSDSQASDLMNGLHRQFGKR